MSFVSRGFRGRPRVEAPTDRVPPGQYVTEDFPVLSAGPTPLVSPEDWLLTVTDRAGNDTSWTWDEFLALGSESTTVDIHCVTKWSKLDTEWEGVPLDDLLGDIGEPTGHLRVYCYGGYTTNLPLADATGGRAWIVHRYEGRPLPPEHGGPARLLVPHLYFWKSAKWVRGLVVSDTDRPGFWESYGYHNYGDPWREQRYSGD